MNPLTKEMFAKMEFEYAPVAVKFSFDKPENTEHTEKVMAFCSFVKEAQTSGKKFYVTAENDDCVGKMVLGMVDMPTFESSGRAGYDFEVFRTPAANARLYYTNPRFNRGASNYCTFAPLSICDFDPDLIIVVADTRQADLLMRANSYISGDLWEGKDSHVMSCSWQFVYPYISGKVNHLVVGMHHGQKVRKPFPDGMQIISIPFQKIDEITTALSEMHWVPISMRPDDQDELGRRIDHWKELAPDLMLTKS
ncbi:MAG: DUF169 domain-containing protein [Oscillospiraceae bacterium]|nr:DUF169 domain-containing protein [Oscillospiraceae bacterium]